MPNPDLLVLNKFGKVEAEGRGLLDLVAMAVDRGVPVVIGVPVRNLEALAQFRGRPVGGIHQRPVGSRGLAQQALSCCDSEKLRDGGLLDWATSARQNSRR